MVPSALRSIECAPEPGLALGVSGLSRLLLTNRPVAGSNSTPDSPFAAPREPDTIITGEGPDLRPPDDSPTTTLLPPLATTLFRFCWMKPVLDLPAKPVAGENTAPGNIPPRVGRISGAATALPPVKSGFTMRARLTGNPPRRVSDLTIICPQFWAWAHPPEPTRPRGGLGVHPTHPEPCDQFTFPGDHDAKLLGNQVHPNPAWKNHPPK